MQRVLLLAVLVLGAYAVNPQVCVPFTDVDLGSKPFPDVPNTFQAKFNWAVDSVNTSYFTEEIFSEDMNIGVMTVENLISPGIKSKMITLADTREYFLISDFKDDYGGDCIASTLASNDFTFPFKKVNGSADHLLSGKDVLLLGANNAYMAYMGTDTIDDVDVDKWNGCLYIKEHDTTYNATYWFTVNGTTKDNQWDTASGRTASIKQIHLKGNNGKSDSPQEQVYTYVYFDEVIPADPAIYEVPLGSYCAGRKNTKPLPTVPDYFSFFMEVHDIENKVLTYTDEYYDYTSNYSRMTHNTRVDRSNQSQVVTLIHDYNEGLTYNIAKTGSCSIYPILADQFDNEVVDKSMGLVRMRNPKEFFDFDNPKYPWVYEGVHKERGIDMDVYISKRPFPDPDSPVLGFWEYYFTTKQWVVSNGNVEEYLEPAKLVIHSDKSTAVTEFNIYKFNQEPPNNHYFDISVCFDQHNESRAYEMVIRADWKEWHLDTQLGILRYWTTFSIEAFSGVRSIRVTNVEFEFADNNRVYCRFRLLGTPKVKGDVKNPAKMLSLDEAEAYLKSSINDYDFTIDFVQQDTKKTTFSVVANSLSRMEYVRGKGTSMIYVIDDDGRDDYMVTNPPTVMPQAVQPGGVAALAIIMLINGVAMVALPFYFLVVRKNQALTSYAKSQLTMSDMQE